MFYLSEFEIHGFWNGYSIISKLNKDVNIFVGFNGSGKTTMVNILQAVLSVDLEMLHSLSFREIKLKLKDGNKSKTISAKRISGKGLYDILKYKISNESFEILLTQNEQEVRYRYSSKYYHVFEELKNKLEQIVNICWLSVHRQIIQEQNTEIYNKYKRNKRNMPNPVDVRLEALLKDLSEYIRKLQSESNTVYSDFQKNVLQSLLYDPQFDTYTAPKKEKIDFDEIKQKLLNAYNLLKITGPINKQIEIHIEAIRKSISKIQKHHENNSPLNVNDVFPLSLLHRTVKIVELSTKAEEKKKELFLLLELFIIEVNNFLFEKELSMEPDTEYGLIIKNKKGDEIDFYDLSSGEKQLFILLSEATLLKKQKSIFIADEPELSLHIAWQRKLVSSIRMLNPNMQLLIATHSPEITGPWKNSIIKMRDIISESNQ